MTTRASLEALIETEDIGLETFHPGGLEITRELAELCRVGEGTHLLDVASGTGESACYLAEHFGARVVGVEISEYLLRRARDKATRKALNVEFRRGDAQELDFSDNTFDVAISECTLCLLDKERVLREMTRVTKPGGHVGIHDVCWTADTPKRLKEQLAMLEGERPETLSGWQTLFERVGLTNVQTVDKPAVLATWIDSIRSSLGAAGQLKVFWKVWRLWGLSGLLQIMRSERIFRSRHVGYGIIVGLKSGS